MARVTIEDCLLNVAGGRFALCLIASKRATQLNENIASVKVAIDESKPEKVTVIALREIAAGWLPSEDDSV